MDYIEVARLRGEGLGYIMPRNSAEHYAASGC